jgi:TonB family protein
MKSTCGSIREWLGAFVDGELDAARLEQVRDHLEACAACRRELDQIQELGRLAKSVEHPRLAEDYWDWQRTKVWHGIRNRRRVSVPSHRGTSVWPKLTTAAAGLLVVLVVMVAGWRTLLERPVAVGIAPSSRRTSAGAPAATALETKRPAAVTKPDKTPVAAPERVGVRSEELAEAPASGAAGIGSASRDVGTTAADRARKSATASMRRTDEAELKVAAELAGQQVASTHSAEAQRDHPSTARLKGRIVSGPVLLESPPLPDADVLDTGTVLLSVTTDSTGRVLSAGVRHSSGSPKLDSLAVRQIRQSRFAAAPRDSRDVSSPFEYRFQFQKKQVKPVEGREAETDQEPPEGQRPRPEQVSPTQGRELQKPDSGGKGTPLKEKTSK